MSDKPQITATIKFRGITIDNLSLQEMKDLRDALNAIVGERVVGRVVERHDHHHHDHYPYRPYWWDSGNWSISSSSTLKLDPSQVGNANNHIQLGDAIGSQWVLSDGESAHYTVALN